jgi:hypothetical protein
MVKAIYFDMDGTIADLYAVDGWLADLRSENVRPYKEAEVMVNMRTLAKRMHDLQRMGYTVGVISWGAKFSTTEYLDKVAEAKRAWLNKHLGSVEFDEVKIVPYGTPKATVVDHPCGLLFDDEEQNRTAWLGTACGVDDILGTLDSLIKSA